MSPTLISYRRQVRLPLPDPRPRRRVGAVVLAVVALALALLGALGLCRGATGSTCYTQADCPAEQRCERERCR